MLQKTNILGVSITNESEKNVSEYLIQKIKQKKKVFITTPNPEILVYASAHPEFKELLNTADVALPDGVGISIAASMLNKHIEQRITGVDFIEALCKASKENPMSMGFIGGRGGVAERTAVCLKQRYPWIKPVWVGEEWNKEHGWIKEVKGDVIRYSSEKESHHIDILFVAFGFPKQEQWIAQNLPLLPVSAAMGVGGSFDYLSGEVRRAPLLLRTIGLEWLFRLIRQPWRAKRQLALMNFIFLVLRERFTR